MATSKQYDNLNGLSGISSRAAGVAVACLPSKLRRSYRQTFTTLLALLLLVLLPACVKERSPEHPKTFWPVHFGAGRVNTAVDIIEASPSWIRVSNDDAQGRSRIMHCLEALSHYSTGSLRQAIQRFEDKHRSEMTYSVEDMAKLFLLNRYLFNVPDRVPSDTIIFGGWQGIPEGPGGRNELWPLKMGEAGRLELVGRHVGYLGGDFAVLAEFDYFERHYGRRSHS